MVHSIVTFYVNATGRDGSICRPPSSTWSTWLGTRRSVGHPNAFCEPFRSIGENFERGRSRQLIINVFVECSHEFGEPREHGPLADSLPKQQTDALPERFLGGRSRALLLAHVRSNAASYRQTLRTLHYASRACGATVAG